MTRQAIVAAVLSAALGVATVPCSAATYRGVLAAPGVVWISDDSKPAPAAQPADMRNTGKAFVPDLVVIAAGGTVRFPNDDQFFHSIYSEGPPDPFDIGFYDNGPGKTVTFAVAGVVAVRCHIHGTMHATIIVVDGPWAQTHAPGSGYELDNVRSGTHTLHVWSAQNGQVQTSMVRL